jgi:hypothetical protein
MGQLTALINEMKSQPQQPVQTSPAELEAVKQQLSELESRIGALNDAIGGIGASLKAIEEGQGAQQQQIETTTQRLGEIQSRLSAEAAAPAAVEEDGGNALAAALMKLKAEAAEGRPFADALQSLSALAPDATGSDALKQHSANGVATAADLSAQLQKAIATLDRPAPPTPAAPAEDIQDAWELLKSKAASLISIRRVDEAKWLEAAKEADARLKEEDIAAAVQRLRSVPGEAPPPIKAWLEAAEARLAVDRSIEDMSASVLKKLGGGT